MTTHGDDESVVQTDQLEECGSIRENELNTRDLLRYKDTDGSDQLPSLNWVLYMISDLKIDAVD